MAGFKKFRPWAPAARAKAPEPPSEKIRGSARDRGYNSKWDNFSGSWKRKNPLCAECDRHGRTIVCDVVDHIVPLRCGGEKFDRANLQSLCNSCHNGWKKKLEKYAEQHHLVHMLIEWCSNPAIRPPGFRYNPVSAV